MKRGSKKKMLGWNKNERKAENITATQTVYAAFRNAIITCEMRPGDPISEQALADRYETSRTPVREACNLLHKEGLLDVIPHKGFFVPEMTLQKVQDLFQARLILECGCAEIAARQITPPQLAELEGCVFPKLKGKQKEEMLDLIDRDKRFHLVVAKATGNEYLMDIMSRLHDQATRVIYLFMVKEMERDPRHDFTPQHAEIVKAIKARDPEAACHAMAQHVRVALEHLLDSIFRRRFSI